MTLFLTILKIIGIILLALLSVAVGLILLILFVPVRYEVIGEAQDDITAQVRVTWLLKLIRFQLDYKKEFSMRLSVLVFPIKPGKKKGQAKSGVDENHEPEPEAVAAEETEEGGTDAPEETDSEALKRENVDKTEEAVQAPEAAKHPIQACRRIFDAILDKLKHIEQTVQRAKSIVEDTHSHAALLHLKDEAFLLLKRICPKKLKVDMSFSAGSPDTTAKVFGILAMFPIGYINRWRLYPDFEADSFYVKGTAYAKGSVFIFHIALAALFIFFDRNCRKLYKKIRT